ncbi:MAG: PQQ-binding-like beta-propeller repeat protein, partial [Planctomycetota bacterium]|nr:PQQ-binding-like beta-propeller repeat protein [Planctomycetota bacterium]
MQQRRPQRFALVVVFVLFHSAAIPAEPKTERAMQVGLPAAEGPPTNGWPCWRGPNAAGVADGRKLPLRWSRTENVRWSVKLPGWGTSSPVVYGNRVFVTSESEVGGQKSLLTLCFDRRDGQQLWQHDFGFGVDQPTHKKSNLAVNTPAVTADAL